MVLFLAAFVSPLGLRSRGGGERRRLFIREPPQSDECPTQPERNEECPLWVEAGAEVG